MIDAWVLRDGATRRSEEDRAFEDLVYRAWRMGHNVDDVSRDQYDDMLNRGFVPDEVHPDDVLPKRGHHDR